MKHYVINLTEEEREELYRDLADRVRRVESKPGQIVDPDVPVDETAPETGE